MDSLLRPSTVINLVYDLSLLVTRRFSSFLGFLDINIFCMFLPPFVQMECVATLSYFLTKKWKNVGRLTWLTKFPILEMWGPVRTLICSRAFQTSFLLSPWADLKLKRDFSMFYLSKVEGFVDTQTSGPRSLKTVAFPCVHRYVPLCPNVLKSKLVFIRSILKTTPQSLLCYSAHKNWNSINLKDVYLVAL